jgi:pyruvate kinase
MGTKSVLEDVREELAAIHAEMLAQDSNLLARVHPDLRDSASNLLHYLVLRRHDLRPLQLRLAELGLSSLGRAESYVLACVEAVLRNVCVLLDRPVGDSLAHASVHFASGQRLLSEHTKALLGPTVPGHAARIMVTMPSEAAHEYTLVHALLQKGMNCMRINCAHDDAGTWARMIENLRRSERALGLSCKVAMDLAGPKLRTGALIPGPKVVKVRPRRDVFGKAIEAARVWLTADSSPTAPPSTADASIPVASSWIGKLNPGDRIEVQDARGNHRSLRVVDCTEQGCWAEATQTIYLRPGIPLRHRGTESAIGDLPPLENTLHLHSGDLLRIMRDGSAGRPATYDSAGKVLTPASIGCTLPEVFDRVRSGEPIWFDDGNIGGVVEKVEPSHAVARITQTGIGGKKLRADKGINLPESDLDLAAMTAKDIEDLDFVAQHADIVQLSFANTAADVEALQQHLTSRSGRLPGIVLKIETRRGFERLPDMLLTAMRWPSCGVMIARGDLAVECGFERLAEVQEEILWICEAAHVPAIWATQVLETLAKAGMPSRAEITDAAMGHRAECVMLNKGPHVVKAVETLVDILTRMEAHQAKKRSMLRRLRLAGANAEHN